MLLTEHALLQLVFLTGAFELLLELIQLKALVERRIGGVVRDGARPATLMVSEAPYPLGSYNCTGLTIVARGRAVSIGSCVRSSVS